MRARLERCSGAFHVRRLELLRDLPGNRCGVQVRRFTRDVVATGAAAVPHIDWMQHVMGLAPGDEALVPEIAAWYRELGVQPRFEIAPAAGFDSLSAALAQVGARQTGFIDALWADAGPPAETTEADVEVRVVDAASDQADVFARVLLGGHEVPSDAGSDHWAAVALWPGEPDWWCYLAFVDGQAAGAAALAIDDGIGFLASASTLPAARRRGCQQALIDKRVRDASAAGCELILSLATPGSISHHNLERGGLGVAHTEVFWTMEGGNE